MTSTARETLENCSLKLQVVSERIDRIRKISNSNSISPTKLIAPPPTPTSQPESPASMPPKRKTARCHECHGPISGYHQGYPHGLGICQLEHYDLCPGNVLGKDRGGHSWTPCPAEYVPPAAHCQDDDLETAAADYDSQDSNASDPDYISGDRFSSFPPFGRPETRSGKEDDGIRVCAGSDFAPGSKTSGASKSVKPPIVPAQKETDVDFLLQAELAELALAEKKEKKLKEIADIRKKRDQTQQNIERLSRQAQGEGARRKETIHDNIDMLRTANQHQRGSRRDESGYKGPTIEDIRRDDFTRGLVEPLMEHVYSIPSFSNAPQHRQGQPRLKKTNPHITPTATAISGEGEDSRGLPSTLYKWVMKRDQYGVEYKELGEVPQEKSPARPRHVVVLAGNMMSTPTGCIESKHLLTPSYQGMVVSNNTGLLMAIEMAQHQSDSGQK